MDRSPQQAVALELFSQWHLSAELTIGPPNHPTVGILKQGLIENHGVKLQHNQNRGCQRIANVTTPCLAQTRRFGKILIDLEDFIKYLI
jgi:hypothetical protein